MRQVRGMGKAREGGRMGVICEGEMGEVGEEKERDGERERDYWKEREGRRRHIRGMGRAKGDRRRLERQVWKELWRREMTVEGRRYGMMGKEGEKYGERKHDCNCGRRGE